MTHTLKSRAEEIDAATAAWLDKRDSGNWAEEDERAFVAWLDADPIHRITYWRMEAAWARTERLTALRPQAAPRSKGIIFFRAAAAAIAVSVVAAGAWFAIPRETGVTYATSVGGHEIITLSDKTRIELNTDTTIRTRVTATERTVWLEKGEALFNVRHDATHPFIVIAGNRRITDLGTEFSIRRDGARLKVALFSGRAFFDQTNNPASSALLTPGDVAIATKDSVTVTKAATKTLTDSLSWRSGTVVFDHATLANAVAEFNRYTTHKLEVSDPSVARLTIGGTFDVRNVEAFADIVQHAIGLRIQERNGKTVISR